MKESKLVLVLGGARAGKSTFALRLAEQQAPAADAQVCFIATAGALDADMAERISRHQSERPAHWRTIEEAHHLDEALHQASHAEVVIVDCLTLFVSNWLLRSQDQPACEKTVRGISDNFLAEAKSRSGTTICVSNEVGLGIVPESGLGRIFREVLGRVNQQFAEAADEVYLLVAGLPLRLKPTVKSV
jgi:adenosylcobinamide kinase/adenosylcobinamide-phosphate guanylyltransferase